MIEILQYYGYSVFIFRTLDELPKGFSHRMHFAGSEGGGEGHDNGSLKSRDSTEPCEPQGIK